MTPVAKRLRALGACVEGLRALDEYEDATIAWAACDRPEWLAWYLGAATDRAAPRDLQRRADTVRPIVAALLVTPNMPEPLTIALRSWSSLHDRNDMAEAIAAAASLPATNQFAWSRRDALLADAVCHMLQACSAAQSCAEHMHHAADCMMQAALHDNSEAETRERLRSRIYEHFPTPP